MGEQWDATPLEEEPEDLFSGELALGDRLPLIEPDDLRAASLSFAIKTAMDPGGFHPRHIAMLHDDGLRVLALIMATCERNGRQPSHLARVIVALLEKVTGGYRPIGIFSTLYRVHVRARKSFFDKVEIDLDRPYYAAGKQRSAIDTVWRTAVDAEAATASKGHAGGVLTDFKKYYEHFNHRLMVTRGLRHGLPPQLIRLTINAYRLPRHLTMLKTYGVRGPAG